MCVSVNSMKVFHKPVLLHECLNLLAPEKPNSLMIDGTLGEGGHSYAFLSQFLDLTVYGIDADAEIQKRAEERLAVFKKRLKLFNMWTDDFLRNYSESKKPDIILLDLGISIFHYLASNRGFSFSSDERLDMRLNTKTGKTALDIVNKESEKELSDLIYKYGEERYSRQIATSIVEKRKEAKIETAKQLAEIIFNAVPIRYRHGRLHPATRTFQALRIAVNGELDRLPELLSLAFKVLNEGGKLAVISFHSLEDRIVKQYFRELSKTLVENEIKPINKKEKKFLARLLTKKPITAGDEELAENPPSRSAKLRIIQKLYKVKD